MTEIETDTERDRLMSAAYTAAQRTLRESHRDEFNSLYQSECAARGIEWTPRKSKEDLALDQIVELLGQFPELGEKLAEKLATVPEQS